jgi:PAS domain-containing protein
MSSENRISRHSQFFKVLLEKIDSRIALFTLEGDLIYANKLFYEMLGMDTSIEINFSSPTWIHPEDNQLYKEN